MRKHEAKGGGMKVLIIGISGFAGSHLARYLLSLKDPTIELYGTYRDFEEIPRTLGSLSSSLQLSSCDITHPESIEENLKQIRPDIIFHLAGISFVPEAEMNLQTTYDINTFSIHHLLQSSLKFCPHAKVILISTSEVYGKVKPEETPLKETQSLNPNNLYSASKIAMEMLAKLFINRHQMNVIVLRPFNHVGPYQSDRFVIPNFSRQMARIKLGIQEPVLEVGDLEPKRDFTDVRDIARGYWLAAIKGRAGEIYNLCSGKAYSIKEIALKLIALTGKKIEIRPDSKRMRKSDLPLLLGSYEKFKSETGWTPQYELESTLQEIFNYWIAQENQTKLNTP